MRSIYQLCWRDPDGGHHTLMFAELARAQVGGVEKARELGKLGEGESGLWDSCGLLHDSAGRFANVSVTDRTVF